MADGTGPTAFVTGAEVLGIPRGTMMSGLSRARQAFRGALIEAVLA